MVWIAPEPSLLLHRSGFIIYMLSQVICCCTLDMTCYIFINICCLFFKTVLPGACSFTAVSNVMQCFILCLFFVMSLHMSLQYSFCGVFFAAVVVLLLYVYV